MLTNAISAPFFSSPNLDMRPGEEERFSDASSRSSASSSSMFSEDSERSASDDDSSGSDDFSDSDSDPRHSDSSSEDVSESSEDSDAPEEVMGSPPRGRRRQHRGRRHISPVPLADEGDEEDESDDAGLSSAWVLFHDSVPDKNLNRRAYAASIDLIGTIESEEDMRTFDHWIELRFVKDDFRVKQNLRLFRRGIAPMWEDKHNAKGGRLVFWYGSDCRKTIAVNAWKAFIGHLLSPTCDISAVCGAVLHISFQRGICIDVWTNTTALRKNWVNELRLKALPSSISVTFRPHHPGAVPPRPPPGGAALMEPAAPFNPSKRPRDGPPNTEISSANHRVARAPNSDQPRRSRRPLVVGPPRVPRRPTYNDDVVEDGAPAPQRRRMDAVADNGADTAWPGEFRPLAMDLEPAPRRRVPMSSSSTNRWQHNGEEGRSFQVVKRWQ